MCKFLHSVFNTYQQTGERKKLEKRNTHSKKVLSLAEELMLNNRQETETQK